MIGCQKSPKQISQVSSDKSSFCTRTCGSWSFRCASDRVRGGVTRGRCRRRRLRGCSWGLEPDGERDRCLGVKGADVWLESRECEELRWEPEPEGDCGGRGRYSRSESESTSYSESVRSSGSSWNVGGGEGSSREALTRRSISLLVVTSTGGACETAGGEREEAEHVGSGQWGTRGTWAEDLDEEGAPRIVKWDAQKVCPQWRVTGARRSAGGAQRGQ